MFPTGTAGAALLVLRISVAATLVVYGVGNRAQVTFFWIALAIAVSAISLCAGFLTPYCSALCCLIELDFLLAAGAGNEFHLIIAIVNSGVLAVLGPGAYSLDARIFGRRLLAVSPRR